MLHEHTLYHSPLTCIQGTTQFPNLREGSLRSYEQGDMRASLSFNGPTHVSVGNLLMIGHCS